MSTDAHLGVDLQVIRILLDVGQAHAGAIAHFAHLGGGRRPALLHGQVQIGNARALVGHDHHDLLPVDVHVDLPAVGMRHGVDLRLEQGHDGALDVGRVHAKLLESALDAAGGLTGIGEVSTFYVEGVMHG